MAKRITQTPEESMLYRETMALVKRANQRLLRMERLTGEKGTFASKGLYDELSSSTVNAVTKEGRISLKKSYDTTQLRLIKRATEEYLSDTTGSTTRGVKKYTKQASEKMGANLSFSQASDIFQVRYTYQWIYEYFPGSEFWADYGNQAKKKQINEFAFVEDIFKDIKEQKENIEDEEMRQKLIRLYNYCRGD